MKITFEIPDSHLADLLPFLTRHSSGHIKIAKKCIAEAFYRPIDGAITSGCEFSAWALENYLREMKSEYIRLKELEIGRPLETSDFVRMIEKHS